MTVLYTRIVPADGPAEGTRCYVSATGKANPLLFAYSAPFKVS